MQRMRVGSNMGSPCAPSRAPPLLLFVIDTSTELCKVHASVLCHLLYFYFNVDSRLTWTWQLYNESQRIPVEFTLANLELFIKETERTRGRGSIGMSLQRAIQDLKWDWNSVTARKDGAVLSPPQLERLKTRVDYKIRNYIFLISEFNTKEEKELLGYLKENLLEFGGKMPLLRIGLIEKRTSLSIINAQKGINYDGMGMVIQSILKLTGGAYMPIGFLQNIALVSSWMIYGMFRGKIGQRQALKGEVGPCRIIDFAKKLTCANVDVFAVPKSILEFQKNSISYSEKDLDFIGGLVGVVKLGLVDFSCFSQEWIDSSLSPFLLCQEQNFNENSMVVMECKFSNGQSRLALLSEMWFDGYLMRFLVPEMSWPLPDVSNDENVHSSNFDFAKWLANMNSTELGNLLFSENMDDSSSLYQLLRKETFGFWRPVEKKINSNDSIENIFDSEDITHNVSTKKVATISFSTMDEALKFMSKSFAEFLYQRQEKVDSFVSSILPSVYTSISSLVGEDDDPVKIIVDHISQNLLHDICVIDWRGDYLLSIGDAENNNVAHFMRDYERDICEEWIKLHKNYIPDKIKWKEFIHEIKIRSAQFQVILLLECVRLHVETEYPLPPLPFQEYSLKRRKSKRKQKIVNSSEPYRKLIIDFIDRICIWDALQVSGTIGQYSSFIEPVVQNYYESSIPELVSEISGKFAVKNQPNRLIESPVFKRRRFLVQRKEVDENSHQPFQPKNLYNELSRKSIPLRKGRKSQKDLESSQKGLSESDRQMIKNLDSKIPERILVLATPQKKVRTSTIIFKSG